jgi:CDP-glycerol glycerophosphotransferase
MRDQARSNRGLFRLPGKALYITTTVSDLDWQDSTLVMRGTAEIRHMQIDGTSKLRIVLENNGTELPVAVERFPAYDSHGDQNLVGYAARIPKALLAQVPEDGEPAQLRATLTQGNVRRSGLLRNIGPGNPSTPPGAWLSESTWLQPLPGGDNRLLLRRMTEPARLTSAAVKDDALMLEGLLPAGAGELQLARTWGSEKIADCEIVHDTPADRFVARIPLAGLTNADDPDDPVTQRTTRRLEAGDVDHPVIAAGLERAVGYVWADRLVLVSRAADNSVVVSDGPVQPIADEIGFAEGVRLVTVSGEPWGHLDFPLVWRRANDVTGADDVACSVAVAERWTAAVDVERLLAHSSREVRTTPTTWRLVGLPHAGRPYAVLPDTFLTAEPSITILVRDHQLTLRPHADRVTIEVR